MAVAGRQWQSHQTAPSPVQLKGLCPEVSSGRFLSLEHSLTSASAFHSKRGLVDCWDQASLWLPWGPWYFDERVKPRSASVRQNMSPVPCWFLSRLGSTSVGSFPPQKTMEGFFRLFSFRFIDGRMNERMGRIHAMYTSFIGRRRGRDTDKRTCVDESHRH